MNISLLNILIPALAGLAGVFLGSLKPWIDWNIEKRRLLREERKAFVSHLREMVNQQDFEVVYKQFLHTVEYSRLRPYLSKDFVTYLEKGIVPKRLKNEFHRHTSHNTWFLDELQRIERKWGLL